MNTYIFDSETNGLLDSLTKLHCLSIRDADTGQSWSYADQPGYPAIKEGLSRLDKADVLVGHNIIGFDLKALKKVYDWTPPTGAIIRDTLVLVRLIWPHIKDTDFDLYKAKKLPGHLIGAQSLGAWGYRLGEHKGEYKGGWDEWSVDMQVYMDQDSVVTQKLWHRCLKELDKWQVPALDINPPGRLDCVELEHRMAAICEDIQAHGFRFDLDVAINLVTKLQARRMEIEQALAVAFPPIEHVELFTPKANNRKFGYVKGQTTRRVTHEVFNPASRQEVGRRLTALGWVPTAYGKDGSPTIDDEILGSLKYPEAKLLAEYYTVAKRIAQIAEGKQAWFKHLKGDRIHGRITSNGAHTGRATHSSPNMGQVPTGASDYGHECRSCFIADVDQTLLGVDMDAVELRDLAGYMARWDGGEYINTVLNGRKEDGTDMHSRNAKLLGCNRDDAKVFFYAFLYGAGDAKLGEILGHSGKKAMGAGRRARTNLMRGLPALGSLIEAVQLASKMRGFLVGLDGRRVAARSENAALNTLLQGAGAIQSKRWIVTFIDDMTSQGLVWGRDYTIVAWVHDELQISVNPDYLPIVKQSAIQAIKSAGEYYKFKCPLTGNGDSGKSWADTH